MIPRSAVEGLIGAIMGLSKSDYPKELQATKIAIEIMTPVRKLNMSYMHTNPDWWKGISLYLMNKPIRKKNPTQFECCTNRADMGPASYFNSNVFRLCHPYDNVLSGVTSCVGLMITNPEE